MFFHIEYLTSNVVGAKSANAFVKWNGKDSLSRTAEMNYLARAFESTAKAFLGGQSLLLSKNVKNMKKFPFESIGFHAKRTLCWFQF